MDGSFGQQSQTAGAGFTAVSAMEKHSGSKEKHRKTLRVSGKAMENRSWSWAAGALSSNLRAERTASMKLADF